MLAGMLATAQVQGLGMVYSIDVFLLVYLAHLQYIYIYIYIYISIFIYLYIYVYVYEYTFIYVYICLYIYIYIYTNIYDTYISYININT